MFDIRSIAASFGIASISWLKVNGVGGMGIPCVRFAPRPCCRSYWASRRGRGCYSTTRERLRTSEGMTRLEPYSMRLASTSYWSQVRPRTSNCQVMEKLMIS